MEHCGLHAMLMQTQGAKACWQVYPPFLDRRGEWQKGEACGYLKLNDGAHNCVSLFLLPYNFPALLHLLHQLLKMPPSAKLTPPRPWLVDSLTPTPTLALAPARALN